MNPRLTLLFPSHSSLLPPSQQLVLPQPARVVVTLSHRDRRCAGGAAAAVRYPDLSLTVARAGSKGEALAVRSCVSARDVWAAPEEELPAGTYHVIAEAHEEEVGGKAPVLALSVFSSAAAELNHSQSSGARVMVCVAAFPSPAGGCCCALRVRPPKAHGSLRRVGSPLFFRSDRAVVPGARAASGEVRRDDGAARHQGPVQKGACLCRSRPPCTFAAAVAAGTPRHCLSSPLGTVLYPAPSAIPQVWQGPNGLMVFTWKNTSADLLLKDTVVVQTLTLNGWEVVGLPTSTRDGASGAAPTASPAAAATSGSGDAAKAAAMSVVAAVDGVAAEEAGWGGASGGGGDPSTAAGGEAKKAQEELIVQRFVVEVRPAASFVSR